MTDHTVLIVGAGPTGLTLACELARRNVDHLIVDAKSGPSTEPKALVLWSAAQQTLRLLGVDPTVFSRGITLDRASYWSGGSQVGHVSFDGLDRSGRHKPVSLPQPLVETALLELYERLGGTVRWNHKFLGADDDKTTRSTDTTRAALVGPSGIRFTTTARWIVGTDGAHSTVRKAAAIDFAGSSYEDAFLLVDGTLAADGPQAEAQYHLHPDGVTVVVPLPSGGHRVFLGYRQPTGAAGAPVPDVVARANSMLLRRGLEQFTVTNPIWQSDFRVHRRLSVRYIAHRIILAGDAAHIHSPAGGQGMNTGIQDATNLAWKLTAIEHHHAEDALLGTYEHERRPVAESVAALTDLQTKLWTTRAAPTRWIRDRLLGVLSSTGLLTRRIVPQLAQLDTHYDTSIARATGDAGSFVPGRFLPQHPIHVDGTRTQLDELFSDPRILVLSVVDSIEQLQAVRALAADWGPRIHVVLVVRTPTTLPSATPTTTDIDGTISQDLGSGGVAIVRPDRIVGLTGTLERATALRTYLSTVTGPAATPQPPRFEPEPATSKETAS